RRADAHACPEHFRRKLRRTLDGRSAAREYDPGTKASGETCVGDFLICQAEYFIHPLMDDVRQQFPRNLTVALRDGARQLDDVVRVRHERLVRAAVAL